VTLALLSWVTSWKFLVILTLMMLVSLITTGNLMSSQLPTTSRSAAKFKTSISLSTSMTALRHQCSRWEVEQLLRPLLATNYLTTNGISSSSFRCKVLSSSMLVSLTLRMAPRLRSSGLEAWNSKDPDNSGSSLAKSTGSITQLLQSAATSESPPISAT